MQEDSAKYGGDNRTSFDIDPDSDSDSDFFIHGRQEDLSAIMPDRRVECDDFRCGG